MSEPEAPRVPPRTVGIVGPGRMGIGIATAVLMAGQDHRVLLFDAKAREPGEEFAALETARAEIAANLALLGRLGALPGPAEPLLEKLRLIQGVGPEAGDCSILFEALPETQDAKRPFYEGAGAHVSEETTIASATSTFDVGVFSAMYRHAGRVLTAHWLNPAFLIPLVEIARGSETAPSAVATVQEFLLKIGKIPVVMRSSPGFVVPRIQAAAMNEAVRILEEGVASPEAIDTAIKAGFGFRLAVLGLIEFIDLGGVDILARAGDYLHGALGAPQFQPPRAVAEKMARGEVGPRAGKGFFDYAGVDTRALFEARYQGFIELLEVFRRSPFLRFAGGISGPAPVPRSERPA